MGHRVVLTEVDGLKVCWGYTGGAGLCGKVGTVGLTKHHHHVLCVVTVKKKGHKVAGILPRGGAQTPERLLMRSECFPGEKFQVPLGRKPRGLY